MTLKTIGFRFFAQIMGGNYVFCCSRHIIASTLRATKRNLTELLSLREGVAASKFFKIFSTDVTSTLCKPKSSYSFQI